VPAGGGSKLRVGDKISKIKLIVGLIIIDALAVTPS
jgi:hypothetical protein